MINQFSIKIDHVKAYCQVYPPWALLFMNRRMVGIILHRSDWQAIKRMKFLRKKKLEKLFSLYTINYNAHYFIHGIYKSSFHLCSTHSQQKKRRNNGHIKTFALFLKKVFCDNKILLNSKMGIALQTR